MEYERAIPVAVIAVFAAAVWFVPGLDPIVGVLVAVLGLVVAASVLGGYGGPYLAFCLGEAFAVGLGTATPLLGVLVQPLVAYLAIGHEDRQGLVLGATAATLAAGAVFLYRDTLAPLLLVVAVGAAAVLAFVLVEAWMRARYSGERE
jgi:hypothetical protein